MQVRHIGTYLSEIDAAAGYDIECYRLRGPRAILNFGAWRAWAIHRGMRVPVVGHACVGMPWTTMTSTTWH